MHYFEKKTSKITQSQHFFGFQLARTAPVLEAGGKPSTRFPPEGLVELPCLLLSILSSSNEIFPEKSKISKKNRKNQTFSKFWRNLPLTFDMTLLEQMNNRIAPWFSFSMNFSGKILTALLVMNEFITLKKNTKNYT